MTPQDRLNSVWLSRKEAVLLLGVMSVAYIGLSIAGSSGDRLYTTIYFGTMVLAFIGGAIVADHRPIWLGLALVISALISALYIAPWLFTSPNVIGCGIALTIAGAIAYRIWWFIPIGFFGIAWTQSRSAWLGVAFTTIPTLWRWNRYVAFLTILSLGLILVLAKSDLDSSLAARLGIWQDTINHMILSGHGFGSFFTEYSHFAVRTNMFQLAPAAYNDFLQLTFELGLGMIPLIFFTALCLEGSSGPGRLILLAYFGMSLTFFPLYIPIIGHLVAMTLGQLAFERRLPWHAGV